MLVVSCGNKLHRCVVEAFVKYIQNTTADKDIFNSLLDMSYITQEYCEKLLKEINRLKVPEKFNDFVGIIKRGKVHGVYILY